ncbi:hypothetical protein ACQR3P_29270 [Rhodococcus sp. IEGM1300]
MLVKDHKGRPFRSIKHMCAIHGVAYTTYVRRKEKGLPKELLLSKVRVNIKEHEDIERYRVDGELYPCMKTICDEYGISPGKLRRMEAEFGSFDAAIKEHERVLSLPLEPNKKRRKKQKVKVDGIVFNCLQDACDHHKKEYKTVYMRLYRNWSLDEAFELKERGNVKEYPLDKDKKKLIRSRRGFSVDKVPYKSLRDAAIAHDIDPRTLAYRVRNGEPVEEALKRPTRKYEKGA